MRIASGRARTKKKCSNQLSITQQRANMSAYKWANIAKVQQKYFQGEWNWFRIAWSLSSFTWDIKAQLKFLGAHQCIHSSASFQQCERKVKSIPEKPLPCSLALSILQNLCLLFCIYLSYFRWWVMVTFTGAASEESPSLQRDIGSTSHLPDLCKIQFF